MRNMSKLNETIKFTKNEPNTETLISFLKLMQKVF